MPQRCRYATRDELADKVAEAMEWRLSVAGVRAVLDALETQGVNPDALVKITVDEPDL